MQCPSCGEENRDVARFCQYCGTLLPPIDFADVHAEEIQGFQETVQEMPRIVVPEETDKPDIAQVQPEEETALVLPGLEIATERSTQREQPSPMVEDILSGEEPMDASSLGVEALEPEPQADSAGSAADAEVWVDAAPVPQTAPGAAGGGDACQGEASDGVGASESPIQDRPQESARGPEPAAESREGQELTQADAADHELPDVVQEPDYTDVLPWRDRAEELFPLEPGQVVHGRYQVIQMMSDQGSQVIYRVRDLQRCARCGSADNNPDEAFCSSCGALMDQKPVALMLEGLADQSDEPVDVDVEDHFAEDERLFWVWREPECAATSDGERVAMQFTIGQRSHTGQVRDLDEDSLFITTMSTTYESMPTQLALFVVADGMGGHEGGEIASKVAIQTLAGVLLNSVFVPELEGSPLSPGAICSWMVRAMESANERVYLERQRRQSDMGTTMTAALVKDWTVCLAHVGDSRAYRWGAGGLEQLTVDHSIVASMVAAGTAEPDEIYTHPQRSVIYRCIGDGPVVEVDTDALELCPGERLVLCCDGLWEMLHNEGIEDVMLREPDPQTACDILVEQANLAGGTDNISVIVAQV